MKKKKKTQKKVSDWKKWEELAVYCIIKVPKVAEQNPQSCMRNFPIIAADVWYFPKPIYYI